jgi:hypothetical protein
MTAAGETGHRDTLTVHSHTAGGESIYQGFGAVIQLIRLLVDMWYGPG